MLWGRFFSFLRSIPCMPLNCSRCKATKDKSAFYRRADRQGQFLSGCIECRKSAAREKQIRGRAAVRSLTAGDVLQRYAFDSTTGRFTDRDSGKPVCSTNGDGYLRLYLAGVGVQAHHAAWLIYHGEWPSVEIDHQDHDRANNARRNLQLAADSANARNLSRSRRNTSGVTGVCWSAKRGKWVAQIYAGRPLNLGLHDDFAAAVAVRKAAATRLGFHPNHGA